MTTTHPNRKEKIKRELVEMFVLFLYLAFFFCALVGYSTLLMRVYRIEYWAFSFALINALVITKVIMIGEYAKLGRKHEEKALLLSAVWKALVFGLLVFAFHIVEEIIKRVIHGADVERASHGVRIDEMAGRAIVVFCVFIPLFLFREIRRVMGEHEFESLVFGKGGRRKQALPTEGESAGKSVTLS